MKITILGSGGAIPTPRPLCPCSVCKEAREKGAPYKKNSSSIFFDDINTVIDCPEDIGDSLNREGITKVSNVFITHWHPDHTFGLRVILEANYNFRKNIADNVVNLYVPLEVLKTLREKFPVIDYYQDVQRVAKIIPIKDGQSFFFNDHTIEAIKYSHKSSAFEATYGYLICTKDKRVLYTPCDTISYKRSIKDLDLLITEMGLLEKHEAEITFEDMIKRLKKGVAKKVILTHIEEIDLQLRGYKYLEELKSIYSEVDFDYAVDGMKIRL